jgi:hypothetical protein
MIVQDSLLLLSASVVVDLAVDGSFLSQTSQADVVIIVLFYGGLLAVIWFVPKTFKKYMMIFI